MSEFKGYRESSRINWGTNRNSELMTLEQINTGAILRIADATELIAKRYEELIRERDYYKDEANRARNRANEANRRVIAMKGLVTKLKNKIKAVQP